ncbi:MAG: UbiA family prenyltransferase [Candidatus Eisenbacteria bacterium]
MLKRLDWFFLTRPIVLIPSWAFLLAGYLRAHERHGESSPPVGPLVPAFLLLTVVLAGVYVINQIFDRETDRKNEKLYLLAEGHVPVRGAWILAVALIGAGLAATAIYRSVWLPWLGAAALLGYLYSAPPVRLKGRPVVDLLANGIGYGGITFLFGSLIGAPAEGEGGVAPVHALPYAFLVGAVFLHTALVDKDGDREAGLSTSAIVLGDRATSISAFLLLAAAAASAIVLGEPYAAYAAIGSAPFFLWGVVAPGKKGSTLGYQWGSLLFVILLVIREPLFGLLLAFVVLVTRLYYRFRFGKVYPSLDL